MGGGPGWPPAALRVEEGPRAKGCGGDSRGWKRQGNVFSLEVAEGTQPCPHLGLSQLSPGSDSWPSEL